MENAIVVVTEVVVGTVFFPPYFRKRNYDAFVRLALIWENLEIAISSLLRAIFVVSPQLLP